MKKEKAIATGSLERVAAAAAALQMLMQLTKL